MKITKNFEEQTFMGYTIGLVRTEWGWFVEVSTGAVSEYYKTKAQAKEHIRKMKAEMRAGYY